jgi:hypothetical protein
VKPQKHNTVLVAEIVNAVRDMTAVDIGEAGAGRIIDIFTRRGLFDAHLASTPSAEVSAWNAAIEAAAQEIESFTLTPPLPNTPMRFIKRALVHRVRGGLLKPTGGETAT